MMFFYLLCLDANKGFRVLQVVEYVKDLVSGICPVKKSETSEADVEFLARFAVDMQYVSARNGWSYWYYMADKRFIDEAKKLLRKNGLRVSYHKSYLYGDVLRVPKKKLYRNQQAKEFVKTLMNCKANLENVPLNSVKSK